MKRVVLYLGFAFAALVIALAIKLLSYPKGVAPPGWMTGVVAGAAMYASIQIAERSWKEFHDEE